VGTGGCLFGAAEFKFKLICIGIQLELTKHPNLFDMIVIPMHVSTPAFSVWLEILKKESNQKNPTTVRIYENQLGPGLTFSSACDLLLYLGIYCCLFGCSFRFGWPDQ
jgi:hypothetical protein